MLKKFLSVMLLATIFIFVSGQEKVLAQDVWIADWKGDSVFVQTHTFRNISEDTSRFKVSVKFVFNDPRAREIQGDYDSMQYIFIQENGWLYKNEHMGSYKPASSDLIASRILNYCLNNLW